MKATTNVYSMEGWQALAQAIVKHAAEDWRMATRRMKDKYTDTHKNLMVIRDCEQFFRSPAPDFLCDINGTYLLRLLREEAASGDKDIKRENIA